MLKYKVFFKKSTRSMSNVRKLSKQTATLYTLVLPNWFVQVSHFCFERRYLCWYFKIVQNCIIPLGQTATGFVCIEYGIQVEFFAATRVKPGTQVKIQNALNETVIDNKWPELFPGCVIVSNCWADCCEHIFDDFRRIWERFDLNTVNFL